MATTTAEPVSPPRLRETLRSELRALMTPGPRMLDEWACVASVMLAILFAHRIEAGMISWAAFTAFVLLKSAPGETMVRAVLRLVGSAAGVGLALLLVPIAAHSLPLAMLTAGGISALGLYGMLTARRAYAWLLFGVTYVMILLDKLERPQLDTTAFARMRMLDVLAGIAACTLVSVTVAVLSRKSWLAGRPPLPERMKWNPVAARHAAQAGIALALLPLLHARFGLPEMAQAGVTIIAVMIVPVAGIGSSGFVPVTRRLLHRAIGCIAGGSLALAVLFLAQGSAPVLIAGTVIGIVIGRHIENSGSSATYVGLQFSLVVLVTLVPDSYDRAEILPAIQRLAAIFIGMALLEPVLLAWHFIAPHRQRAVPGGDLGE